MQPVQSVVQKQVQLLNGDWVWCKGKMQKKDGFWALAHMHVKCEQQGGALRQLGSAA